MIELPDVSGGESTPWIGDIIRDVTDDVVSFQQTSYPIRLEASPDALVWSVPEGSARAIGGTTSFASGLERFAITTSVEVWRFPKLQQERVHEVVLLLDRQHGTAASIELLLRSTKGRLRPHIRILRGTLAGHPWAYGGFAFPRHKPGARRVSFDSGGSPLFIDFDRTGQPSAAGSAGAPAHASGHVLLVAPEVWAVAWRTSASVSVALIDESAGIVNGQTLSVSRSTVTTFASRTRIVRSL